MTKAEKQEEVAEKKVTFAQPDDITQILGFAYKTYEDVKLEEAEPSFKKITAEITDAVVQEVALVIRNEEDPKFIDACMVFKHAEPWWSEQVMLKQLFFYVKPELRGKGLFNDLLNAAEEYGKMSGLTVIQDIIGEGFEKKGKTLLKRGYAPIGSTHILTNYTKE